MIPTNVSNYYDAQWWLFTHIGMPLIFIGVIIAGIVAYVYQNYYDN